MDFYVETTSSGQDMSYCTNEIKSVFENYKREASPVNTTLTCNNAKVWAFYHKHPEIDFEKNERYVYRHNCIYYAVD
jgi:hypothetical protein